MKVIEIFKSIDGEGIRTGVPVTFIRLEGCNLRCSYCDTKYSYNDAKYEEMSVEQIIFAVTLLGLDKVTLTGGEPLLHKDVDKLVAALTKLGIEVNIETNGSVSLREFHSKIEELGNPDKLIYTVDYKCKSSKMSRWMEADNIDFVGEFHSNNVIKFVVGSVEDLEQCSEIVKEKNPQARVFISPVFGKITPKEIVEFVLTHDHMKECTVQVQLHKIIWDPEVRGV